MSARAAGAAAAEPHVARWWRAMPDGRLRCEVCPRQCTLRDGQRGFCFVRARVGDAIVLTTYGRSSGFVLDPVEKKPLAHVLPGSTVLSFGTAGCNLACKYCQNWEISTSRDIDTLAAPSRATRCSAPSTPPISTSRASPTTSTGA